MRNRHSDMRRFYAPKEDFTADRVVLGPDETRHLGEVLRLREDHGVRVFDGEGREFVCSVETVTKKAAILSILNECGPRCPESPFRLVLAAALTKGEKFDLVVQKAVELGVAELIPIETRRCDVKVKDPEKRLERWRRIVIEASKQCGRATLMAMRPVTPFADLISSPNEGAQRVFFSEKGGAGLETVAGTDGICALVGPEGGWTDQEMESATRSGALPVTLGGRILRAETAAVAVVSILQSRFGDLN